MDAPEAAGTFEHLADQLDASGRDFERVTAWFLRNDPEYAALFTEVWLWDDWPGRWGRDKGIDLIGQTHDGRVVAVQAKNYGERHRITKADVDTFLSESNRPAIDERLLIATTDLVSPSGVDVMDHQEKPVARCLRTRLAEARVTWPATPQNLDGGARIPPKLPLPHQEDALAAITAGLAEHDRGKVIMACGTGKTLVALWAAERQKAELVLVLVPSLQLLRQTAQDWASNARVPSRVLKVCSDKTISGDEQPALIDAADLGPGVTTDPADIRAFLNGNGPRVVFATYQSSPQIAEAMAHDCPAFFDLAVCDEAHWCAGTAGKSTKTVLYEDRIRASKRLFFTATPVIYPPHEIVRVARKKMKIISMGNRELFGPEIHRLSFADAIGRDLLCPYQVVVMPVTDLEVQQLIEHHHPVTTDGGDTRTDAYSLATQIACLRAMRKHGCRRMVCFHPRIDRSKRFSAQFAQAVALMSPDDRPDGRVWTAHVDGAGMPRSRRRQILAEFATPDADTYRLLCNVKVLSEGVDVPGIDGITMIDTRRGPVQIIQIVGRAVRKAEGKDVGTIVLPVLVRQGEDPREALARSEHRPIMNLLAALRATDPDIERSVDDLWVEVDPDASERPSRRRFVLDLPAEVGPEFADAVNVMLVEALAPAHKHRLVERGVALPTPAQRSPKDSAVRLGAELDAVPFDIAEGLEALMYAKGRRDDLPLGHVPRETLWYGIPYDVRAWWRRVRSAWNSDDIDEAFKYRLADVVTWLDIDPERDSAIRGELRRRTSLTVADHIDAWTGDFQSRAREELQLLAEDNDIGPRSHLDTARICTAFRGPGMDVEEQVRVVCKALLMAGDECRRRAWPKFFAQGFMEALDVLASKQHRVPPARPLERSATGQFAAGWQTAEPFFDEARRARGKPTTRRQSGRRTGR